MTQSDVRHHGHLSLWIQHEISFDYMYNQSSPSELFFVTEKMLRFAATGSFCLFVCLQSRSLALSLGMLLWSTMGCLNFNLIVEFMWTYPLRPNRLARFSYQNKSTLMRILLDTFCLLSTLRARPCYSVFNCLLFHMSQTAQQNCFR